MMDLAHNIFGKPRLYLIEINDKKINDEICKLLIEIQKRIGDFAKVLHNRDVPGKKTDGEELIDTFLKLKEDISKLSLDLDKIINIELEKKNYIVVRDRQFVNDKKNQLEVMQKHIDSIVQILRENPSIKDYNKEILHLIMFHLHQFSGELSRMLNDDKSLSIIYKALCDI